MSEAQMADGDGKTDLTAMVVPSIAEVATADWDACARPHASGSNPFVSHAFLLAAEASGSATRDSGWQPQHVVAQDGTGRIVGAVPLYLKGHSYGEYVFDWAWADAWERAGGRYYPKLLAAVPFTPVTGPRLLLHPEAPAGTADALAGALIEVARRHKVSSLHVNFLTKPEADLLAGHGFLVREGQQFQWHNAGYGSFDDFLGALSSRKRKNLRKERLEAVSPGIEIRRLTGDAITPADWDAFYEFYIDTAGRKWGQAYLEPDFFTRLSQTMADDVLLVIAYRQGRPIAGAINLIGQDALYGRNWGALEEHPCLHFEVCYYQAIDFAIERGLARVEAGAGGGSHKLGRGYLPAATWSAHWIADDGFKQAVARFVRAEQGELERKAERLIAHGPFKKNDAGEVISGVVSQIDKSGRRFEDEP
ncbi:MAG TPA: GNAT family N-acetyltransferase [Alphaproteobacteria bacterium]|jgi:hypothetical protein